MNDSNPVTGERWSGEVGLVSWQDFISEQPFHCEDGGELAAIRVRYETYGHLSERRDNAILICHALSGDHHCAGVHSMNDRKTGWWNAMIGPGKPIDTNRFFVVCTNALGGCQGTTGPSSIDPATGKPYNLSFPSITIGDMVEAQYRLMIHLGIARWHTVAGGSMGGMQVLQWAICHPECVARMLPMATTARQGAQSIAFNEVGRSAIMQDPEWRGGDYEPDAGPSVGLAVARMMAHITYLSDKGMDSKFGRTRQRSPGQGNKPRFGVEFEVESYLRYQGKSFVNRFDANTYLYLTKALDRFDLYGENGHLEEQLQAVTARTLVIGFTSDWLFPPEQNRDIIRALLRCGKDASYAEIETDLGHDSFLVHSPRLFELVEAFLKH